MCGSDRPFADTLEGNKLSHTWETLLLRKFLKFMNSCQQNLSTQVVPLRNLLKHVQMHVAI